MHTQTVETWRHEHVSGHGTVRMSAALGPSSLEPCQRLQFSKAREASENRPLCGSENRNFVRVEPMCRKA
jgi:hypothetical protein